MRVCSRWSSDAPKARESGLSCYPRCLMDAKDQAALRALTLFLVAVVAAVWVAILLTKTYFG